ncbi:MAG TPA: hypothetical protein PKZ12_03710 [Smithellaceae bacterium]|nr:hypothetical protein [Smithellaceae bacterium]
MKKVFVVSAVCLFLISCATGKEYVNILRSTGVSGEYLQVLEQYTVKKVLYSQMETRLQIAATYKSRDFQDAYRKEYSRLYELSSAEIKAREETQTNVASDFTEYVFYAYVPEREANDFSSRNSLWKVYLQDARGEKIYPMEIRKIENVTVLLEQLYPYINRYHGIFYSLKFPPEASQSSPSPAKKLVVTGVMGKLELDWH